MSPRSSTYNLSVSISSDSTYLSKKKEKELETVLCVAADVGAAGADTYRLFSKETLLSSSLSAAADPWLTESSRGLQASSRWSVLALDLRL